MLQREPRSLTSNRPSAGGACMVLCILATFSMAAIAQTPSTKSSSTLTVIVTDKDNGAKVTIAKGGVVVVRLEVTSGTGYSWAVAKSDAPQLKALGRSSREKSKDSKPGATETQIFRFKAAAAGSTTLEFHYARPWEKTTPPAKTFQVQIAVQ